MKYALFILLAVGILVAAGCSPKVPRMHTEPLTWGGHWWYLDPVTQGREGGQILKHHPLCPYDRHFKS